MPEGHLHCPCTTAALCGTIQRRGVAPSEKGGDYAPPRCRQGTPEGRTVMRRASRAVPPPLDADALSGGRNKEPNPATLRVGAWVGSSVLCGTVRAPHGDASTKGGCALLVVCCVQRAARCVPRTVSAAAGGRFLTAAAFACALWIMCRCRTWEPVF